ncbi:signal recognition particle GTPase [Clostridium moniliforme]|uniref:Signal recognition particle GTPase n=1 Tax=Clostridium moniliforme TaxID=39489 RepID=A0ABS4F1J9_9CLOT|nr:Rep family protein [Clostridium moniliforme]MBP1890125.1 signal recognition particle GTPase [Clostridium moniliforme]
MSKSLSLRRCEVVSQITETFNIENIKKVLNEKDCIKEYAYIIHDKDKNENGELKKPHIHLIMRFKNNQPQNIKYISKWFNLNPNFVSKIKSKKFEDAIKYLVHLNAPEKFQYLINEVTANFNVKRVIDNEKEQNELDGILDRILNGEIREYNKTIEIDPKILTYKSRLINEAFKVRAEHIQATVKERDTSVIFITGTSGSGKTTLAKKICESKGLAYYVSSGSNDILDGYSQQPALIIDDIRPSCMGLSDLLKLLDNHTLCSIKSRYKNKIIYCDLIILTTVLDLETFYQNVFTEENEPITQLKRRCGIHIRMNKDYIFTSIWDNKKMNYSKEIVYKNNIISEFVSSREKTNEDIENELMKFFPFIEKIDESQLNLKDRLIEKNISNITEFKLEKVSDEIFRKLLNKK